MRVSRIDLEDGTLEVQALGEPKPVVVSGLDLSLRDIAFDAGAGTLLAGLRGHGQVHVDEVAFARSRARDIRGTLRLGGGHLTTDAVRFQTPQGPFEAKLDAQLDRLPFSYTLSLHGNPLDVRAMLAGSASGPGPGSLRLEGRGRGAEAAGLTGSGMVRLEPGALPATPLLKAVERVLGRTRLVGARYEATEAPFRVEGGRVLLDRLRVRSEQVGLDVAGWASFAGPLELTLGIRTPRAGPGGRRHRGRRPRPDDGRRRPGGDPAEGDGNAGAAARAARPGGARSPGPEERDADAAREGGRPAAKKGPPAVRDHGFTPREVAFLRRLQPAWRIQRFLDEVDYDVPGAACRSPRRVLRERRAQCMDGALFAAAALRVQGRPPLIVDLEGVWDSDHVLAVFREDGCWGAIARSNYSGLRFREPIHRTVRDLAISYVEAYFNLRRQNREPLAGHHGRPDRAGHRPLHEVERQQLVHGGVEDAQRHDLGRCPVDVACLRRP